MADYFPPAWTTEFLTTTNSCRPLSGMANELQLLSANHHKEALMKVVHAYAHDNDSTAIFVFSIIPMIPMNCEVI